MRFSRKSQFAKFGSISTFKSVNWMRNDAWPIQVMATSPCLNLGKTGRRCCPWRGVNSLSRPVSRKNVRGLKCFAGVKSLNERGSFRRGAGRLEFALAIGDLTLAARARPTNLKIKMPRAGHEGNLQPA